MTNLKTKIFLLLFAGLGMLNVAAHAQASAKYAKETEILFQALKTGDYELMKPLLDPMVKIGNLPQGYNDMVVPQVITQLPKPESYTLVGEKKDGKNIRVTIEVSTGGKKESRSFVFNSAGKVVELDILGKSKASYDMKTE